MCLTLGVARSGYYAWRKRGGASSPKRRRQVITDQQVAQALSLLEQQLHRHGAEPEVGQRYYVLGDRRRLALIDLYSRKVVGWVMCPRE